MTAFITALLANAAVFSVLLAALLLVRRWMGKTLSAVLRYALWAVVIVKLLVPFGFESTLSPLNWLSASAQTQSAAVMNTGEGAALSGQADTIQTQADSTGRTPAGADDVVNAAPVNTVQTQSVTAQPLSWMEWAFIVWAAGCAACAGWLHLCRLQIRRRMLRCALQPSEHMLKVFELCRQELGIRRSVRLRLQSALNVPAITSLLTPTLIVPGSLDDADDVTLRHVFLHELTHYRRGDLIVLAVLNALSCIYWFNPLVWLCFSLVRRDMETVCDQRVLERLSHDARSGYVKTVLHYAGAPANHRLAAALSINDGRAYMENRIHNMFRTRKTGSRTRIAATWIALLMLASCALTACQPTQALAVSPQAVFVENVAQSEYAADVPQDVKLRANVTVRIDATANVPDDGKVSVYSFERGTFTQRQIKRIGNYFLPGASFYNLYRECGGTRQELEDLLAYSQTALAEAKAMSDAEFEIHYYPLARDQLYLSFEEDIAWLQEELETAPEEPTYQKYDASYEDPGEMLTDTESGGVAMIDAGSGNMVTYYANAFYCFDVASFDPFFEGVQPNGVTVTQQEAIDIATETLSDLGFTDMALTDIGAWNIYQKQYVDQMMRLPFHPEAVDTQCWGLVFRKTVGSLPAINAGQTTLENVSGASAEALQRYGWSEEIISIAVDDTGVVLFSWFSPFTVENTVTRNAELLPFDDILDAALDNMYYYIEPIEGFDVTVTIHTIQLDYAMAEDEDGTCRLVPVWNFIGDAVRSDGSTTYTLDNDKVFVTVDALTGSVIGFTSG